MGAEPPNTVRKPRRARAAVVAFAAALSVAASSIGNNSSGAAQTTGDQQPSDDGLRQAVIGRILDARAGFFADIHLDIIGGDALLTGRVATVQDKARATALVRSVPGIQTVTNVIHVGAVDDIKRVTSDLLLERQIRKEMREAFGTQMPPLNWRVTNGIVYVFGHARTEWEHNRALAVAKQSKGVIQVVDHLRITSGS